MHFTKDPNDVLDYSIDWSVWLGVETIAVSVWTVPDGITSEEESNTDTVALIRLSGGTDRTDYELLNHITTNGGQETERTIIIQVRDVESDALSGDALDRERAIKLVTDRVQPDVAPTLTSEEIAAKVDEARLATTWAPNTAYNTGDVVVSRFGHAYQCIQPGTSQAGARTINDWPAYFGSVLVDGSSTPQLTWEEVGTDRFNPGIAGAETNIYDISRAEKACIGMKITKAAEYIDKGDAAFSQVYEHLKEQRASIHPFRRPIQLIRC